jgi:hypothetical protein
VAIAMTVEVAAGGPNSTFAGTAPAGGGRWRPDRYARFAGALYLVIIVVGIAGPLLTRSVLIDFSDPITVAQNITANVWLWRLGIALNVVMQVCDVPVMVVLFLLLSPINRNVALAAIAFNVVQTAALVANQLTLVAALLLAPENAALSTVAVQAYSYGEAIGLVFFGFACVLVGYLIRRAPYLPWILGALMQVAGVAYVVNSLLLVVAPERVTILISIPSFVAELCLAAWLLVRGVDVSRWGVSAR